MKKRSNYFQNMSKLMLLFVFLGFAPSFYLKFLISDYPFYPDGLPLPHIIHGIILTVWYTFLVLQTQLIQSGRFSQHKQLGMFGVGWAVFVITSTIWVISVFPKRMEHLAQQLQSTVEEVEPGLSFILWLDVFMCVLFVVFLTIAFFKRHQASIHKRLMLFTGLVFIFAATNRMAGSISHITNLDISMPLGLLLLLSLTGSLLLHDYKTIGKILPISLWCFGLYWICVVLSFVISVTEYGKIIYSGSI